MSYTKAELYEKFENLPDDVQQAFLSVDTFETIEKIRQKYNLHVDQSGQLSEQIGYVMLGITRPENFLQAIQTKLGVSTEVAGNIVKDINLDIFFPIRQSLEKINNPGAGDKYKNERVPQVENYSPAGNISETNIHQEEKPLPNPDNNAIIIEHSEQPSPNNKIFDQKMSKLFRLPKEETDIGVGPEPNGNNSAPKTSPSDPYRESIK